MFMDDAHETNPLTSQRRRDADDDDDDEAEESLSFSDLPIDNEKSDDDHTLESFRKNPRRSSSEPLDLFEFFTAGFITSEISPAEDLIFCGRLLPLNHHSPLTSDENFWTEESRKQAVFRKRSESLSGLQSSVSRSNSAKINLKRNSRSLDYRKLNRQANSIFSPTAETDRNCSIKSGLKPDSLNNKKAAAAASKPRWYLLMFGMVKFPAEMELSDIKSRQVRRSSSALFPANENKGKFQCNRSSGEATWKILRALSCKNDASIDVTASLTA